MVSPSGPFQLPCGYFLHIFDVLESTMDEAYKLAKAGAPAGTIVLAQRQTKGRGRLGRPWVSLMGNLFISLIFRPTCPLSRVSELGFLLAHSVGLALSACTSSSLEVHYKWPNDILLGNRKIAGLLLEAELSADMLASSSPQWLVVGLGLNLKSAPEDVGYPVTSLQAEGFSVSPSRFLSFLCLEIDHLLTQWGDQGFSPIREAWLSKAWGIGREMTLLRGKEKITGFFETIAPDGSIILKNEEGARYQMATGEILLGLQQNSN